MSSGVARWAFVHLDSWTWFVAEYRVWVITLATVVGLAAPLVGAARRHLPGQCLHWLFAAAPWRWRFPRPR